MKFFAICIAGLLLLALPGRTFAGPAGQDLLLRYGCRGCHRIWGRGGSRGPDLAGVADRLTADRIRARLLGLEAGDHHEMPIFDYLSREEQELLVTMLKQMH
jgi:mono/diheme cytochrome c family protein